MSNVSMVLFLLVIAMIATAVIQQHARKSRTVRPRNFCLRTVRRRRALSISASVVSQIATIMRLNLPLAPALAAASRSERGWLRRVFGDLSQQLADGAKLSVALRRSIPSCPALVESVVRAGEGAGQLPRALATLETILADRLRLGQRLTHGYLAYPFVLVLVIVVIVGGMMIKVVPKFKEIFVDFDAVLPVSTRALIRVSEWFVEAPFVVVGCLLCLLLPAAVGGLLLRIAPPWRAGRLRISSWIVDTIRWYVPVVHDIENGWGTAASLEVLGMGLTAGLPLDQAAQSAGEIDVNVRVRRRFEWFSRLVARGEPPEQAARQVRLGPVAASAISSLLRGCDPDVALGHAARYYRANAYRWWHALAQFCWPAITLTCATAVAFIVLALFEPLIALIDSTMGLTGVM